MQIIVTFEARNSVNSRAFCAKFITPDMAASIHNLIPVFTVSGAWCSISLEYTQTHPFNGSLSGTAQVSRYQKDKTNLDFTEARDSEWQWHQLGYASLHLTPDR